MKRSAGILMPIFCLPSKYGIGCFDKEAYNFVDKLAEAGQTYWQLLPMGPTSMGDSPYQSFSTFAGNPYFIDLEALIKEGVLTAEECEQAARGKLAVQLAAENKVETVRTTADPADAKAEVAKTSEDADSKTAAVKTAVAPAENVQQNAMREDDIDYARLYNNRMPLLKKAYERSKIGQNIAFKVYCKENWWWLDDYALFMALKDFFKGKEWSTWPEELRLRKTTVLQEYQAKLQNEVEFQKYVQFKFASQWKALKKYANDKCIKIVGDLPIYVAMDSADTWANPKLFQLDKDNVPIEVAGVPPDAFTEDGQLWGNPIYNWPQHEVDNYQWWMTRLWYAFELYDVVRIDHFRGFDEYFCIKYGAPNARNGHWTKGPGFKLFKRMQDYLGKKAVIAEDLGYLTESVVKLVKDTGFPGMKILEFAFDVNDAGGTNGYLPHNATENTIMYTGTHDNETVRGWLNSMSAETQALVREYLCDKYSPLEELHLSVVAAALRSKSATCIIPLQDYLGLDNSARINVPSTVGQNWRWRVTKEQLTEKLFQTITKMSKLYGRYNWDYTDKLAAAKRAAEEKKAAEAKKLAETQHVAEIKKTTNDHKVIETK